MKICDLEFTRYAFQIMMDESHRQSIHMMTLMFLSSPRCSFSHRPETLLNAGITQNTIDYERFTNVYEKLKVNRHMKKRELT